MNEKRIHNMSESSKKTNSFLTYKRNSNVKLTECRPVMEKGGEIMRMLWVTEAAYVIKLNTILQTKWKDEKPKVILV